MVMQMATPQPKQCQQQDHPVMGQQLKLASLMQNGGLIVIGETVITLHEQVTDKHSWMTIGYGIPCLAASEEQLVVSVTGIDDGETLYEFRLSSRECYKEVDHHFHVLTATAKDSDEDKTYGMTFAHELVAERFLAAVKQLAPNEVKSSNRPHFGHGQQLVSIEATDLPSLHSDSGRYQAFSVEEAGALTASGRFKSEMEEESVATMDDQAVQLQQEKVGGAETADQGLEEVDKPNLEQQKETLRDRVDISHPTSCKHVAHVGSDTPVHTLVRVIKNGEDPSSILECDNNTEHSPPPPSPPPPTNFQTLLQKMCSLNLNKEECSEECTTEQTDYVSQTAEEENPEETFHKVIGKLIHKKLHDEAIYSKLVSFTASGREEKCEKPTTRAASVIIHDHGIVCL